MSTICYRDGIMAADSRAFSGGRTPIGAKMKIHRLKDGSLFGVSSPVVGLPEALRDWFNAGADVEAQPANLDFHALLIKPDGEVFYYSDSVFPSGPLAGAFWAIGSGEQFALGAMAFDADAVQAATIAADMDTMSAAPIVAMALHPEPAPSPASDSQEAA